MKLGPVVINYVQKNGYTMLLDNTRPAGWSDRFCGRHRIGTDISQAVVDAYNACQWEDARHLFLRRLRRRPPASSNGTGDNAQAGCEVVAGCELAI